MSAKPSALALQDQWGEMLIQGERTVVHDCETGKYFQIPTTSIPKQFLDAAVQVTARYSARAAWTLIISGLALLVANVTICWIYHVEQLSRSFPAVFAVYIVLSVLLHECAHIIALRTCGRRFDRVGFKLHYLILPAFFVRMNESNMLLWTDKVVVHIAGIWSNLAINLLLFAVNARVWNSSSLGASLEFAVITLAANAVPALSSDGFRVLLAACGVNEFRRRDGNPPWLRVVRVGSWFLVAIYGMCMIVSFYLTEGA